MKILQAGNPNGWKIEQECTGKGNGNGGCNTRLLVSEDDILINYHTEDISGYTYYYYTFKCPCCGVLTDISERKVPVRVRDKAIKKYYL